MAPLVSRMHARVVSKIFRNLITRFTYIAAAPMQDYRAVVCRKPMVRRRDCPFKSENTIDL